MKHLFTLILLTASIQAWSIQASVDFLRFSNADQQYIEVNYRIFANSLSASEVKSGNEVLSTIVIYKGDEIVDFQKKHACWQFRRNGKGSIRCAPLYPPAW